jgi:hypothetical protein
MARESVRIAGVLLAVCTMAVDARADEQRAPSLSLVWVDVAGTAPWAFSGATREVAALLSGIDVRVRVRRGDVHAAVTESELIVILLPRRLASSRLSAHAMGAISMSEGSPRSLTVFTEAVARTLGLAPAASGWSLTQRRDFGVALGRVVVHELVHALIPGQPHERRGLMAANLNRVQLVGAAPSIAPETAVAFRSALGVPPTSQPDLVAALPRPVESVPGQ